MLFTGCLSINSLLSGRLVNKVTGVSELRLLPTSVFAFLILSQKQVNQSENLDLPCCFVARTESQTSSDVIITRLRH